MPANKLSVSLSQLVYSLDSNALCTLRISTRPNTGTYLYNKDPILTHAYLFSQRHIFDLFAQCSPIISLKLSILHTLLTPILMQPADQVL